MRTRTAALGTLAFAATVPATVVGVIPRRLATRGTSQREPVALPLRAAGLVLMFSGAPLVADAFVRFVRNRGTPAPIAETADLVVSGPYRVTRNPQYVGVVAVVAGQGLLWREWRVLAYAAGLAAAFDRWVKVYEEPRLRRRFGADYARYAARVPRWLGRPPRAVTPS
jgi:protein-S-isoprenylcysteine O-methyltransferase Ste14